MTYFVTHLSFIVEFWGHSRLGLMNHYLPIMHSTWRIYVHRQKTLYKGSLRGEVFFPKNEGTCYLL